VRAPFRADRRGASNSIVYHGVGQQRGIYLRVLSLPAGNISKAQRAIHFDASIDSVWKPRET